MKKEIREILDRNWSKEKKEEQEKKKEDEEGR